MRSQYASKQQTPLFIVAHVAQIKVVCSSGGKFTKVANGIEYQGGETRLIAVSNFCTYHSMLEALERVTGSTQHAMGNSNNSELVRAFLDLSCMGTLSSVHGLDPALKALHSFALFQERMMHAGPAIVYVKTH